MQNYKEANSQMDRLVIPMLDVPLSYICVAEKCSKVVQFPEYYEHLLQDGFAVPPVSVAIVTAVWGTRYGGQVPQQEQFPDSVSDQLNTVLYVVLLICTIH